MVVWAGTVKAEPTDRKGTVNRWMNLRLKKGGPALYIISVYCKSKGTMSAETRIQQQHVRIAEQMTLFSRPASKHGWSSNVLYSLNRRKIGEGQKWAVGPQESHRRTSWE